MTSKRRPLAGFTLVEVLIASTILFGSLVVISEAYRTSMAASHRAEAVTRLLAPLPLIVKSVRQRLRDNPIEVVEGSGEIFDVQYRFAAKTARFEPPPPRFDPDLGGFTTYAPRFRLYDVTVILQAEGYQREFLYQELAWQPNEIVAN
jgi:type II secretory pathway pseudopilin PulG